MCICTCFECVVCCCRDPHHAAVYGVRCVVDGCCYSFRTWLSNEVLCEQLRTCWCMVACKRACTCVLRYACFNPRAAMKHITQKTQSDIEQNSQPRASSCFLGIVGPCWCGLWFCWTSLVKQSHGCCFGCSVAAFVTRCVVVHCVLRSWAGDGCLLLLWSVCFACLLLLSYGMSVIKVMIV